MKVDWGQIEYDYVVNGVNQRDLAKKYGVTGRTVATHSKDGKWVEKRKKHMKSVSAKLQQMSKESLYRNVDRAIAVLSKDLKILDDMSDKADSLIYTTQSPGRDVEAKVNAAVKIIDELRKLAGVMDPKDEAKHKLERERFEFDKAKAAQADDTNKTIRVELDGDIGQWAK